MPARTSAPDRDHGASSSVLARRARAVADALESALPSGRARLIEHLLRAASRLRGTSPRLAELMARAHLARNEPEEAIAIIDTVPTRTASLRLLRAVCLLRAGRREDAHADLLRWALTPGAPLDARILLAALEWEHGEERRAITALAQSTRQLDDPHTLEMLTALTVGSERCDDAAAWLARLDGALLHTATDRVALLRLAFRLPGDPRAVGAPTDRQVEHLAVAAVAHEDVLPALVAAELLEPDAARTELLERLIDTARSDLRAPARADAMLARLAIGRGDLSAAEALVQRGWTVDPIEPALSEASTLIDEARRQADPLSKVDRSVIGRIEPDPDRPAREYAA